MTVVSYQAPLIEDIASEEAVDTTSSQILLSRGVARSDARPVVSVQSQPAVSTSLVFESASAHFMSLGYPACSSVAGEVSNTEQPGQPTIEDITSVIDNDSLSETASFVIPEPINHTLNGGCTIRSSIIPKDKGKGKEVDRGRQMEREPRVHNPLERCESVPQRCRAAIELDGRPIRRKPLSRSSTFYDDPTDPRAVLDDSILEPCPNLAISNNVLEVLDDLVSHATEESPQSRTRAITSQQLQLVPNSTSIDDVCPGTSTTVFGECQPLHPQRTLSLEAIFQPSPDVIRLERLANPSPNPSKSIHDIEPTVGARLPTEIIQQIFYHLSPPNFNSARRVCRSWFFSSLERSLLETMFRRGGWASSITHDSQVPRDADINQSVDDEWHLSKRLSRECALGADWTGNGVVDNKYHSSFTLLGSAFVHTSTIDFTEVAVHYSGPHSSGTIFTMSSCGRFLMAANGCLIYVYEINRSHHSSDDPSVSYPGYLRPVTSIICPRRVVACSMDTSSYRYAIAALLDGRTGLVCDLDPTNIAPAQHINGTDLKSRPGCSDSSASQSRNAESCGRPSFLDRVSLNSSANEHAARLGQASNFTLEPPFVFPGIVTTSPSPYIGSYTQEPSDYDIPVSAQTAGETGANMGHVPLPRIHDIGSGSSHFQSQLPPHQQAEPTKNFMPIETGPRSLYRNLCSEDDPPRSVAICPQRRCVAFGCSAGIELHWVDALTGQDLSRWFPLTAPSDYLYFLPPRKSVDSAKKLRLISSSARPGERAAISQRAFGGSVKYSPFWDRSVVSRRLEEDTRLDRSQGIMIRLRGEGGSRRMIGSRMVDCSDHYYAIPLSDGYHILFTDPATGLLCLGSDAPIGGPTKLLRKIWFKGPEGQGSPIAYAGGADLTKGVKVVAAYGTGEEQSIWFFSVPPDVFTSHQGPQTLVAGSWLRSSSITESNKTDWQVWWPSDDGLQDWRNYTIEPVSDILPKSIWPVKVRGQEIGSCSGLVDLTVDSGPDMTVWAFSKEGISKVWKIDDGNDDNIKTLRVMREGSIREEDADGDVVMTDASPLEILEPPFPLSHESFDGTSALVDLKGVLGEEKSSLHHCEYASNGDMLKDDKQCCCHERGTGGIIYTNDRNLSHTQLSIRQRSSLQSYESYHNHAEELLAGIARIDVEVRG